ncbi:tetratricopeptide repeat-containing sensor histidine kinase [Ancylomarina sp. YFZ004]
MRKFILLSIACLAISFNLMGSIFSRDSLNTKPENYNQLLDSIKRMKTLRDSSYIVSADYGKKIINLVKKTEYPNLIGQVEKQQGTTFMYQGLLDSALFHYNKALVEFKQSNQNIDVGKVLNNIAIVYRRQNKQDLALENYLAAIDIYKPENYLEGIAGIYFNVGSVYHSLNNYDQTLRYYTLALSMFLKQEPSFRLARVYGNLGDLYLDLKQYNKSIEYLNKALELNEKYDSPNERAIILLNFGQVAFYKKEFAKALVYYEECEQVRINSNERWGLPKNYRYTAQCLAEIDRFDEAFVKLKEAEKVCEEYGLYEDLIQNYALESSIYEDINETGLAFEYYKKMTALSDSLNIDVGIGKYNELKVAHNLNLKEKELAIKDLDLSRKNILLLSLIGFIILATAFVLFYLRSRSYRNKLKTLSLEQKVRLSQMNPHFLFNSLSVIQDFILGNENDKAFKYMSKLSGLVRGVLENSTHEFITVREELDILTAYVELQNLRFGNSISYRFDIDSDINLDEIRIPPMLAQPIIENALIHGELRNNPKAEIKICLIKNKDNNSIDFTVEDNGIGILKGKSQNRVHKSMATEILKDRVRIYNYYSKSDLSIVVTDLKTLNEDLHGTRVHFSIPLSSN